MPRILLTQARLSGEFRSDPNNKDRQRNRHFRIRQFSLYPFEVSDVLVYRVRELLHGQHEYSDIDPAQRIRYLHLEHISIPAGHVAELNLYLHPLLLEISLKLRLSIAGDIWMVFPAAGGKLLVEMTIQGALVCREHHRLLAPLACLRYRKCRDGTTVDNVEDFEPDLVEVTTLKDFLGVPVVERAVLHMREKAEATLNVHFEPTRHNSSLSANYRRHSRGTWETFSFPVGTCFAVPRGLYFSVPDNAAWTLSKAVFT